MSTRHLMNIGMGTVALLLAASVGLVFNSLGDREADQARIELAMSQQGIVQNISRQATDLANADNLVLVRQARQELGSSILLFDQNLATLLYGGTITDQDGKEIKLTGARSSFAKTELGTVAELWIQTGLPLADLAAGEFSIFSSAGQNALDGLRDNGTDLVNHLGEAVEGLQAEVQTRHAKGNLARWMALGLTAAFIGLGLLRFKPAPKSPIQVPKSTTLTPMATAPDASDSAEAPAVPSSPEAAQAWDSQPHKKFISPVDFDNVNASVDQLSVDMNTIASSTDKMGLAIDSVGFAMQGMLFSLQQMAQDTAEGYKIVRGANNAATYTHNTAGELAESAQEMSRVVARVTQLAMKTKQVAGQIEAEAVSTGSTGEAFTSVVASEVKGLAQQTSRATAGIEQTVAEILGTARKYEDAIGQILKNISGINKVSENFGEMMLHPPNAGVAGTPLPAAAPLSLSPQPVAVSPVDQPVAQPVEQPVEQPAEDPDVPNIIEPAAVAKPESAPEPAPKPDSGIQVDDPVVIEPTSEEVAEKTASAIEETAADPESSGSSGNVFMLGGAPKKAKAKPALAEKPKEDPKKEPEPEPKAGESAPNEEEDDGSNIFMLNKPEETPVAKTEEPAAAAPEPEPEPAPDPEPEPESEPKAEEPAVAEEKKDGGANVFMLNKPKDAPAAAAEETPVDQEEAVTVPADAEEEKKDDGGGNIFMLNKPK